MFHSTTTSFVKEPLKNYLNDLKEKMQSTLADRLNEAKKSADNWAFAEPREKWLDKPCAQIALVTTQIMWTEEVARAFDEVEAALRLL